MGFPVADTGSVTEDTGVVGGFLSTSGDVDYFVTDDTGQWTAETISGSYGGGLVIDSDGVWTYTALNDHPAIDALDDGDTLTEVFTVTSLNGTTTVTITINGATDPPCFVQGALIDTPRGPRLIETLELGDVVLTRDAGPQRIRWIGGSKIDILNPDAAEAYQPIRLHAHAFGPGVPERDILVSPMHRVVLSHVDVPLLFGETEVLCAAQHLVNGFTITRENLSNVTYFHMIFDDHQIVKTSGVLSESFYPGNVGLDRLGQRQQDELFSLFPDLRSLPESYGRTARMVLRGYEARVMRDRLLPVVDEAVPGQVPVQKVSNLSHDVPSTPGTTRAGRPKFRACI